MHHLEKSKIDSALIYKETKIDSALPKFGKKKRNCCTRHRHCNKEIENSLMPT